MPKQVIVSINKQHLGDLHNIASKLEKDGLQVSDIKDYGLIFGQLEDSNIDALKNHIEVNDVEEEKYMQLPHPDSDVQ